MMKLSKTAWNNVIIFSVMAIILLINATNEKLFPKSDSENDQHLLPNHSVILTFHVSFQDNSSISFERIGRSWQMKTKGRLIDLSNQQIEQIMFAWQQASGLTQADNIVIDETKSIKVEIGLVGQEQMQKFTLYSLSDQLLIKNQQTQLWLAFPAALSRQLVPSAR